MSCLRLDCCIVYVVQHHVKRFKVTSGYFYGTGGTPHELSMGDVGGGSTNIDHRASEGLSDLIVVELSVLGQ